MPPFTELGESDHVSRGRVISTEGNFGRYPIAPFPIYRPA